MANSDNQVELKLNLDISGVQSALYQMIQGFQGTDKELTKAISQIERNFKTLEATIKRFGINSEEARKATKAYQASLTQLVANGIDPASTAFQQLQGAVVGANGALESSGNNLKKTNMMYTNLALVVQDLPYGFRGIQNNLPALIGGIAGVGGAAYLAFSALIALYTAFGEQIDNAIFKTSDLEKAQKELVKTTIEAAKSTADNRAEISKVQSVLDAAEKGFISEADAVAYFNSKLGDAIGSEKTLAGAQQAMINKVPKYVEAIGLKAKAEAYYAKAAEYAAKKDIVALEDQTTALDKLLVLSKTVLSFAQIGGTKGNVQTVVGDYANAQEQEVTRIKNQFETMSKTLGTKGDEAMTSYFEKLKEGGMSDEELKTIGDKFKNSLNKTNADTKNALKERIKDEAIANIDLLKEKQKFYKDNVIMFASYEQEIINKEEELAVKIATIEGKNDVYIQTIRDTYEQQRVNSAKQTGDKILQIQKDLGEAQAKELEKERKQLENDNKELDRINKERYNKQLSDIDQYYNNLLDFAVNDKEAQKEILMQKNADLTEGFIIGAITYEDYIKRIADNSKKIGQITKSIADESYKSMLQIGNGLMNSLGSAFDMLIEKGMSLGDVLTNAFQSLLKQLAKVIATALVAVLLLSILFKGKLAMAGGAGKVLGGLIGQGMGLGGLIGGGGGTATNAANATSGNNAIQSVQAGMPDQSGGQFVLRGNDLVLALNRSENSLNLRRGA
jgi:hypothetical protein